MNDRERLNEMFNQLFGEVLRTVAADDHALAELWLEQMKAAGGFYVSAPTDGLWSDVLVGEDVFCQLAPHPDPGTFIVRIKQWGRTRELTLAMVAPDDGADG